MTREPDNGVSIADLDVPPAPPLLDEDSETVLDEAVMSLAILRFPSSFEDAMAELHALTSLIAQANARVGDVVARALDQDYGWREIACCLASTPENARRRYGAAGKEPPLA